MKSNKGKVKKTGLNIVDHLNEDVADERLNLIGRIVIHFLILAALTVVTTA